MSPERPVIHLLNPEDLERSVQDPRLARLLQDGWTIPVDLVVAQGDSQQVALLLVPPPTAAGHNAQRALAAILCAILLVQLVQTAMLWAAR